MARFYTDEDFPMPVSKELRRLGHDVLTCQENKKANRGIPDGQVLAAAISADRIVLTLNRNDYIRLHRRNPKHEGIVVCTFDENSTALAYRIHTKLTSQPSVRGQLIRVYRPG